MNPSVSIIITSWNTKDLLQSCLQSIQMHPPLCPHEIIVVDNASRDGSSLMVKKIFPQVKIIENEINQGYAGGNNIGFAASSGEYVLLLGSDTVVHPNAIQQLYVFLKEKSDVGIVACRLLQPNGELQHSCKKFPTLWNAVALYSSMNIFNRKYLMQDFDHNAEREVDQVDATCIMIRRAAVEHSIFDERFTILYNDVDLCQRVKKAGWRIIYTPIATVTHYGSQSTRQASLHIRLIMYKNILLYYSLYWGIKARIILTPILIFRYILITRSMKAFLLPFGIDNTKLT